MYYNKYRYREEVKQSFFPERHIFMKKWQLVSTSLIFSTLMVSNGILLHQYKVDTNALNNQIISKNKLIKRDKNNYIKILNSLTKQKSIMNDQSKLIKEKSTEIHKLKQQLKKATTRNESPMRQLNMNITAYTSNCYGCSGLTFTGHDVRNTVYYQGYRVVAADLNVLPLYSIIEIKTKTEKFKAIVIDKGGLIKGHILDLLIGSYDQAIQFGRQKAVVKVLRKGKGKN